MPTDKTADARPIIRHSFDARLEKPAYSLTWDWDSSRWIEALEPERGEAMTLKDYMNL